LALVVLSVAEGRARSCRKKCGFAIEQRSREIVAEQAVEVDPMTKACELAGVQFGIGKETLRGFAARLSNARWPPGRH
jgi:hypothetical protein